MKTLECDIVVVAAGPSGLAAAVTAAEQGMNVIVLEKNAVVGGTANMGMGPFGVESRIQKENMVNLRREEAFRLMMDYTHWKVDARKVREYIWKSGETIDWLENMGVRFSGPSKYFPSAYATWHTALPEGGDKPGARSATAMNTVMYETAKELGVDFHLNTAATELIEDGGEVIGVRATETESGEKLEILADAVIVATGGFGDNPDMIREYCGYTYGEDMLNTRVPGVTGDGLRMVWAIGGAKGEMTMERILASKIPNKTLLCMFRQPATLMVNLNGERVTDESIVENYSVLANVVDRQPKRRLISILDSTTAQHYARHGVDFPSKVHPGNPAENFEENFAAIRKEFPTEAFCGDTPAELAAQMGIPAEVLEETIQEYNTLCAQRYDDIFCKDQRYLRPLTGKLYAVTFLPGAYGSLGGIQVNYRFEVLNTEGKVIPGLYASGTDTCDIYAGTYLFTLPGNTMGYAINSGRLAAEQACKFLKSFE